MSDSNESAAPAAEAAPEAVESQDNAAQDIEAVSDSSEESAATEPTKEIAPPEPKLYKVKIDGKELSLSEEEMIKHAQLGGAAQKRMQEAAAMRKQLENFANILKSDPEAALAQLGLNVEDFAEKVLEKKVNEMKKSPEQRERDKMQQELERYKRELESSQKQREQEVMEKLQNQAELEIQTQIDEALKNSPDLPGSPYVIKRIAEAMMFMVENGRPDVRVEDVLPIVKKRMHSELQEMFGKMPEDALENVLGKPNIDRLRKKRLAQKSVTSAKDVVSAGNDKKIKEQQATEAKKIPMRDFFKTLGNK